MYKKTVKMTVLFVIATAFMLVDTGRLCAGENTPELPATGITRFHAAPVVDGRLDDEVWAEAAQFELRYLLYETDTPEVTTTAYLGYDDEYMYIGVNCLEDGTRKPTAFPGLTDSMLVGAQDNVELFLMPDGETKSYYHFLLAAGGAFREQRLNQGQRDMDWAPQYHAAAQLVEDGWQAEWAIPLYLLGEGKLSDNFRLNICRNRQTHPMQFITWSPLGDQTVRRGFHDPDNFGRLENAGIVTVKKAFAPRLAKAVIRTPWQPVETGGFSYELALGLENPGGLTGAVMLITSHPVDGGKDLEYRYGPVAVPSGHADYILNVRLDEPLACRPMLRIEANGKTRGEIQPRGFSLLTSGTRILTDDELKGYGADARESGEPIGGGAGYSRIVDQADAEPATAAELVELLNDWNAKPAADVAGKIIKLPSDADWNIADVVDAGEVRPYNPILNVPAGVTLAGDRGRNGRLGPLLRFIPPEDAPADIVSQKDFIRLNQGARLTGIRVRGPDPGHLEPAAATASNSRFRGVRVSQGAEVDNCVISHFSWACVDVMASDVRVRWNELSDSAYPVLVGGGSGYAEITGNLIRWGWHAIAGGGQQGTGYEAAHNLFVHIGPGWAAHAVDMHAWRAMMRGHGPEYPFLSIAGDKVIVRNNTFQDCHDSIETYRAIRGRTLPPEPSADICIRGVPRIGVEIYRNRFVNPDPGRACQLSDNIGGPPGILDRANFRVWDNVYGPDNVLVPVPFETRPEIRFVKPALEIQRIGRQWSTRHVNVLKADEKLPVEIEVATMPPLDIRRVTVVAGNLDVPERELFAATRAPLPGEIVLNAADWGAGCYYLTVTAEDNRGVVGRHSTSFTIE